MRSVLCTWCISLLIVMAVVPTSVTLASAQGTPVAASADEACAPFQGTPEAESSADDATVDSTPAAPVDVATLDFDVLFLDAMIPHHEILIDIAHVVQEQSERTEIQQMADVIISVQGAELESMISWRAEWYPEIPILTERQRIDGMNVKLSESPGVGGIAGLEEMSAEHQIAHLAEICAAGTDIDLTFIDTIVPLHSSSVILAQEAVTHANHREIGALAMEMVADQQAEMDQVLLWRTEWFPDAPFPDHHEGA